MEHHLPQTVYQQTIAFAGERHAKNNQLIPGTSVPYIVHSSNVCMEILFAAHQTDHFNLEFAIKLALLHDILEDTDTTESELSERFGTDVLEGVKALTKNDNLPKEEKMIDSLERIKKQPKEVWAVKLADRITNLQPPPAHWTAEKIDQYHQEACLIYETLKEGNTYLAVRLKKAIENYK